MNRAASPRSLAFLLPGPLDGLTGGTIYDRRMVDGLRAKGWQVEVVSLGSSFPWPTPADMRAAEFRIAALPDGTRVVADGLAFGAMPDTVQTHAARLHWVALVHHPLALETGLDEAQRRQLFESEHRALMSARGVIVTSTATAQALADYGVPAARIAVVEPGTAPAALAVGSAGAADSPGLSLLCVATLTPRKGHVLLLDALAGLQDRRWMLHCVGSLTRDPITTEQLRARIAALGLAQRVVLHGELDAGPLEAMYHRADAFVLPSFHEGYGMALAEALAHGLPVVSTSGSAIPGTVPADAGVLVAPGDGAALRTALARLCDEPAWRAALARGARAARTRLPGWPVAVGRFEAALAALAGAAGVLAAVSRRAVPKATTQLRRRLTIARSACDVAANSTAAEGEGTPVSGFSADWLALREPFDQPARDAAWPALDLLPAHVARRRTAHAHDQPFTVIDLACGSGANLRALAPRVTGLQRWRLIDHDPALLAAVPAALARWAGQLPCRMDQARRGDGALHITAPDFKLQVVRENTDLAHGLASIDLAQADLVTASALLDLVSAPWLEALLHRTCAHRTAVLFALSVDGRTAWEPADEADGTVHWLFGQHQRRDKGFGPALGPHAVAHACRLLAAAGYTTRQARSDWVIHGAHAPAMLAAMVDGMAAAAIEQQPGAAPTVLAWQTRRRACAASTRLTVGHEDLVGIPS